MATRGRPRKTPVAVAEAPAAESTSVATMTSGDELTAMKEQVAYQLAQMLKAAEKLGVDLATVFPQPPVENKLEVPTGSVPATGADGTITIGGQTFKITPQSTSIPAPTGKPKAGQYLPGGAWVQWTKADLDPEDTVTFVPLPIPGMVYPFPDENGYQKIRLDINGLVQWLTVGAENTVNRFFHNYYAAALSNHRELEAFKRNGPAFAPWGARGPDGRPAWQYTPMAASFGMNIDGHSLRIGGPTPLDITPSETAGLPPSSTEPQS